MSEIQRADRNARQKTIKCILVMMVVFAPTIYWLNSNMEFIEEWIAEPDETVKRIKFIFSILIAIGATLLLVASIYIFRLANAVLRSGRYPPPNIKVIRDTRIRHDVTARRIGRLMQGFGMITLVFLVAIIMLGWTLIQNVDQLLN